MATDLTPSTTPAPAAPEPAAATEPAHDYLWAIAWGGAMLIVLSLWLRAKFEDLPVAVVFAIGVLGLAALVFTVWQLLQLARQQATLETAAARRTLAGFVLTLGGGLLLVLAVAFWFMMTPSRLAGFGEYSGLGLLGLAALVGGKLLLRKPAPPGDQVWVSIRNMLGVLRAALYLVGAALVVAFLVVVFHFKVGSTYFPEQAALICGGTFFLLAALYLQMKTVQGEMPLLRVRVFLLVLGGTTGLIVTLMILGRMYAWRNEVFLGGMTVWLGDGAWRIWFCAYVLIAGLGLMFGSLLLARSQIHESVVLRRGLYGYNTVVNGVIFLAILILANILFYIVYPYTINWTQSSFSTLHAATKNLLAELKQPTTFYVMMAEGEAGELKSVMDNVKAENSKLIKVQYISPDLDQDAYREKAKRYKELRPDPTPFGFEPKRGVLIVYGDEPVDPAQPAAPYAFVPINKIFETKQDNPHGMPPQMAKGKTTKVFKAEPEIMKELKNLASGKEQRKLLVIQGHGELDIDQKDVQVRVYNETLSRYGMSKLVERFKKDDYEVKGFRFTPRLKKEENFEYALEVGADKRKEIPDGAYAVIIAGASEAYGKDELDALERYLDRGGRLLAFFDTVFDEKYTRLQSSGLEEFLKKYGVDVRMDYAVMPEMRDWRSTLVSAPARPATTLARQFARSRLVFAAARPIKPLASAGRFKAEALFQVDAREDVVWTEETALPLANIAGYMQQIRKNPDSIAPRILKEDLPVAVTVTEGTGEVAKPRMVVFGDTDFIINSDRTPPAFLDLVVSSLEWMSDKPGYVGPVAREQPSYDPPRQVDGMRLIVFPGLLMMLSIAGLGVGLWLVRRR